jgi:general stress protein YciG
MDPEKQRRISRLGGLTSHRLGKAHTFTPEEAREAGKKGHARARRQ